jgi:hypothetical protein
LCPSMEIWNWYCSAETDYFHVQNSPWRSKQYIPLKHCYPDQVIQPISHYVFSQMWKPEEKNLLEGVFFWGGGMNYKYILIFTNFTLNVAALCTTSMLPPQMKQESKSI